MTIPELEKRVQALEQEVGALKQLLAALSYGETPAEPSQAEIEARWARSLAQMGIKDVKPIPPEQLREMMIAEGVNPEDNEFSRAIIEAREAGRG